MIKKLTNRHIDKLIRTHYIQDRLVIVNIRADKNSTDEFDDTTALVYNNNVIKYAACTCDPGLYYLKNPMHKHGTAIVANGYYKGLWKLGLHLNKYLALVQNKPVLVFRDNNKDNIVDFVKDFKVDRAFINTLNETGDTEITVNGKGGKGEFKLYYGFFGINYHRASLYKKLKLIGVYSAGCCVVQHPQSYFSIIDAIQDISYTNNIKEIDALYINESDILN